MEKLKKLSEHLTHPFIVGILGSIAIWSFLNPLKDETFYLLLACFVIVLPKIFLEFFLICFLYQRNLRLSAANKGFCCKMRFCNQ
mgnify:CR=1 FL=1